MTTELTVREMALPDSGMLEQELKAVRAFQATVKKLLISGHDYGVIPGTQKPTLLKPGAEKIDKILHLADTYEMLNQVEDWQKGFFHYEIKCRLVIIGTDTVVSEGMGSCNSMEAKYRYRWVFESALPKDADKESLPTKKVRVKGNWTPTYRIENENPQDLANTILKMAKKRAHVDATLSAGRLSDIFTQDIEDLDQTVEVEKPKPTDEPETPPEATEAEIEPQEGQTNDNPQPKRDPASIKTITDLQKALWEDFKLQPKQQLAELNLSSWNELAITPSEAYQQIATVREP